MIGARVLTAWLPSDKQLSEIKSLQWRTCNTEMTLRCFFSWMRIISCAIKECLHDSDLLWSYLRVWCGNAASLFAFQYEDR